MKPSNEASVPHETAGDVRRLSGHSGAIVTLHHNEAKSFVRKQAGSVGMNLRLEAQALKQGRFYRAGVPCPKILDHGAIDGLFHFDMEFVAGTSVAHQCQSGILPDRDNLVDFLKKWLLDLQRSETGEIEIGIFEAKIRSIRESCHKNAVLASILPAINHYTNYLLGRDWSNIPQSDCHGDLTLENILATKNGYFLIDFDVPDLSSYFLDVAKLFQDLTGHWCLRHQALSQPGTAQYLNAQLALGRLKAALLPVLKDRAPNLSERLNDLVILNLMRVLPYCRDEATAVYVLGRINVVTSQN
jgi:tRNA A-37 threonylcarbamoyl transferase component Bud32